MKRMYIVGVVAALALAAASMAEAQAAPTCAVGKTGILPAATIAFTAPATNADGSALSLPLTYNLYQSLTSTAEVKVASALSGSPIAVSTGLTSKTTYYFKVSVTDAAGNESTLSAEVCKTFPASPPGTVINITIS